MNKKKLIILIAILIFIIIVLLIVANILKKNKEELEFAREENPDLTTTLDIVKLNSEKEFCTVENCINKYFNYLNDQDKNGVYNLLNSEYIRQNNITNSNVMEKVYSLNNGFEEFFVKDIYYREISFETEYQYYIFGEILGENYSTIQTIYIVANLDYLNRSFNITIPSKTEMDEQEYLGIINDLKSSNTNEYVYVKDLDTSTSIELNEYNEIDEYLSDDPYALQRYLDRYCTIAVYYPDIAYNLLDEEYRNKRFGSVEEYKEYIKNNEYMMLDSTVSQYSISEKDGYTQYVIIDTKNNYYIFKVTDIFKYNLLLDYYTVEIDEITGGYDDNNVQGKVAINIQKVIYALKNDDYRYVYDKLSEEFKSKKYPNLNVFKEYISGIIPKNSTIEFNEFNYEGETYIYNITLQPNSLSSGNSVDMQIIMQLKDNRDFVMSFNIK